MKEKRMLRVFGQIDGRYVDETELANTGKRRPRKVAWMGAVAAVLAVAVLGGVALWRGSAPSPGELPRLTVDQFYGAMGYEGYLAYSPEELTNNCPWDESMTLETLPVYQNKYPADSAGYSPVDQVVKVEFDPPVELPEELHFTYYSTYDEMTAAAEYLKEHYAEELGIAQPVADIQGGDRDIFGRQQYRIYFYDGAGDVAQQLVSRSLACQWWCCDEEGRLWIIWKTQYDLSEKVGDYPIINAAEARELLCKGNYITTVPYAMPGEEHIVRVELLYRSDRTAQYFMPYYRFLVEVPEAYYGQPQTEEQYGVEINGQPVEGEAPAAVPKTLDDGTGMKTYGAYYVPAVRGEYLTEMPVWDGSFNG